MKRRITFALALLFSLSLPLASFAASQGHGSMKGMDHGSAKGGHEQMAGHEEMKDMTLFGEQTRAGVTAMAHIKDVGAAMKKAGMDFTHHVAIMFQDAKTGKAVTEGQVAMKVTGPDGKTGEPVKLVGMGGHFGADLALKQKGEYTFEVGTKLADGQKRQFEFKQTVK